MEQDILALTPRSVSYLNTARKWAMFLAIIGFIMVLLLIAIGIFFAFVFSFADISAEYARMDTAFSVATAIIYFISAVIYFIPTWYLFQFSRKLRGAIKKKNQEKLADSFQKLKNCFAAYGILTILAILLYGIFFAVGLIATLGSMGGITA